MPKAPLLISIPPSELARCEFSSAIFPADRLSEGSISEPLRHAFEILKSTSGKKYSSILCVARPEMFVESFTLRWLKERIAGASDHIYLTDGRALKAVPGMHNRIYFYGCEWVNANQTLGKCLHRAPEQLSQFRATINDQGSIFANFPEHKISRDILRPKGDPEAHRLSWSYPLYSNPHSPQDSADRMFARGEISAAVDMEAQDQSLEIILCSESSLQDLNFCRILAHRINQVAFDSTRRLIIQLPVLEHPRNGNVERMIAVLCGLALSRISIPRAYLKGVQLISALSGTHLQSAKGRYHLTIPQSIATWQWSKVFFANAKSITCHLDETTQMTSVSVTRALTKMIGCPTKFEPWTEESRRQIERTS